MMREAEKTNEGRAQRAQETARSQRRKNTAERTMPTGRFRMAPRIRATPW